MFQPRGRNHPFECPKYTNRPGPFPLSAETRGSVPSVDHWKLTLSYDGTRFHGWQVQPGLPSIQGTLASALHRISGETVLPQGSGRTDAGVHALAQVASVSLRAHIPAPNLVRALNHILPASIRVLAAEPVAPGFHARRSAIRKTYEYRMFQLRGSPDGATRICPPFLAPFVWDCPWPLDLDSMASAAELVHGTHDFSAFAASDPDQAKRRAMLTHAPQAPSCVRTVLAASLMRTPELLTFRISGNGFLHHMVRNIVGTLVEVGRGAFSTADFARILASGDRTLAGPTAPARGLFLTSVEYEDVSP